MKTWNYIYAYQDSDDLVRLLRDGWEPFAVSVQEVAFNPARSVTVHLKREITEEP